MGTFSIKRCTKNTSGSKDVREAGSNETISYCCFKSVFVLLVSFLFELMFTNCCKFVVELVEPRKQTRADLLM